MRAKPYMGSDFDKRNPASIKIIEKWEQEYEDRGLSWEEPRARVLLENRTGAEAFDYEPYHFAWCALFTPFDTLLRDVMDQARDDGKLDYAKELATESIKRGNDNYDKALNGDSDAIDDLTKHHSITIDPVSGEVSKVYALCAIINLNQQCLLFQSK